MKKPVLFFLFLLEVFVSHAQTHWQPVDPPGSAGMTATLTAVIVIDGNEQYSDQLEVGIFSGEECRGASLASYVAPIDRYLVFLSIFGIEGEEDGFRLYDHESQMEIDVACEQVYVYHNDNNSGTVFDPYEIVFESDIEWFEIALIAEPSEGGTLSGDGMYPSGDSVVVSAEANAGFLFLNWTEDDMVVSEDTEYRFVIDRPMKLYAHFVSITGVEDAFIESGASTCRYDVYSISGTLLFSLMGNRSQFDVPWENLASGVYLVKITSGSSSRVDKIVKR